MPTAESVLNDALQLSPEEQELLYVSLGGLVQQRADESNWFERLKPELDRRWQAYLDGTEEALDIEEAESLAFADD